MRVCRWSGKESELCELEKKPFKDFRTSLKDLISIS